MKFLLNIFPQNSEDNMFFFFNCFVVIHFVNFNPLKQGTYEEWVLYYLKIIR